MWTCTISGFDFKHLICYEITVTGAPRNLVLTERPAIDLWAYGSSIS